LRYYFRLYLRMCMLLCKTAALNSRLFQLRCDRNCACRASGFAPAARLLTMRNWAVLRHHRRDSQMRRRPSSHVSPFAFLVRRSPGLVDPFAGQKARMVWAERKHEGEDMRVITDNDLAARSDAELAVLFHVVSQALADSEPQTDKRRKVIASLQTISRARAARHYQCTAPGL
ncbi:MAG: hypothetical protein K8H87_03905, partial [Pseudorhodoplanes sp.]|nr:hypothetical protein [Pseudorhodoplanes sp.]